MTVQPAENTCPANSLPPKPEISYEVSKPDGTLYTPTLETAVRAAKAAQRAHPHARVVLTEVSYLRTHVAFGQPKQPKRDAKSSAKIIPLPATKPPRRTSTKRSALA